MISSRSVYSQIEQAISETNILRGGVHVGAIPHSLPKYPSGLVMEYAVVWPRVPGAIDDEPVAEHQLLDGFRFPFQVSVVSDDLGMLMDCVDAVVAALNEVRIDGQQIKRQVELEPESYMYDDTLTPTRWWAPLVWTVNVQ